MDVQGGEKQQRENCKRKTNENLEKREKNNEKG